MSVAVRTLATAEAGEAADLRGGVVLVVDVLRATTTLAVAFAHGAAEALPAGDVPTALRLADGLAHAGVLLCGERGGKRIPGFDLGNSPLEYTCERVAGRPLVFASTNGSRALAALRGVARAGAAALVNAGAAARWAAGAAALTLLCSGEEGRESPEDLLGAGAVLAELERSGAEPGLDRLSARARDMYREARGDLHAALRACPHGAYLESLGFAEDLKVAARQDSLPGVPRWRDGRLVPPAGEGP
ncbi:MAG TPA: 2-phosphosulfolactate phosphatase [Candidatus Saccharimonadales bacterium]|nr:2-phosphosulfolactate phosphatase [Candidatus Saccharimonadales bacterium]